ncbi:MAG: RNase adapter RapZ [Actinomycetes bacterium]
MSGAGRSTAADALEDLGWFVVDNMPPQLLPSLVELGVRSQGRVPRIAAVTDVRGGDFFEELHEAIARVREQGTTVRLVYLEADDDSLVRRFEGSRRPHPLQADGRIVDGIEAERALLTSLRETADVLVDTSELNVHQLRERIGRLFATVEASGTRVTVMSFGFKYGLPADADMVIDCRFLPNPHWVPELRMRTGLDEQVSQFVLNQPLAEPFVERFEQTLRLVLNGYRNEGKRYALLSVGCTGGKHRSVAVAEELARRLRADPEADVDVTVVHRDVGRE